MYIHSTLHCEHTSHTHVGSGLQLSLVVLLQSERFAGSRVEQSLPGHLPTLHSHHLQHRQSLHGGGEGEKLESGASLTELHSRHIRMSGYTWEEVMIR